MTIPVTTWIGLALVVGSFLVGAVWAVAMIKGSVRELRALIATLSVSVDRLNENHRKTEETVASINARVARIEGWQSGLVGEPKIPP